MPYDPTHALTTIKGQSYLQVKDRLVWLEKDITHYDIESKLLSFDNGRAIVESTITIRDVETAEDGTVIRNYAVRSATGLGSETLDNFEAAIEKAQTKSIGRALGMLGFGTAWAVEFNDADGENMAALADSPVGQRQAAPQQATRPQQQYQSRPQQGGQRPQAGPGAITQPQINKIELDAKRLNIEPQQLWERFIQPYGVEDIRGLTKQQGSAIIDAINNG